MTEMIKCGGLMERGGLCLVEVLGFAYEPGQARGILDCFGRKEIALSYLSIGRGPTGKKNMSFCVDTNSMARERKLLDDIRAEFKPEKVEACAPVTILTLYGPHFLEKHALASMVFDSLCFGEVDVHTVCSSVNSISIVVNTHDRDAAVDCLQKQFHWPK